MEELLRRQWAAFLEYVQTVDLSEAGDTEAGLGDWTVTDLVAHVGLGMSIACDVRPIAAHDSPLSIGQYVAAYPPAAAEIAAMTEGIKADIETDPIQGLRDIADRVWAAIGGYDEEFVLARRGPMRREDYLVTRLMELVIHGDDLWRALRIGASPVLPDALRVVSDVLATAYVEKTGVAPAVDSPIGWVRRACGREPSADPALPLL